MSGITWDRCDVCGGEIPMLDGNNDHDAPSVTGGECPGHVSPGGLCGCYDDDEVAEWVAEIEEMEAGR